MDRIQQIQRSSEAVLTTRVSRRSVVKTLAIAAGFVASSFYEQGDQGESDSNSEGPQTQDTLIDNNLVSGTRNLFNRILSGNSRVARAEGLISKKAEDTNSACVVPLKSEAQEGTLEKPCYGGVVENTFQLGSFVYRPSVDSDNGKFDPEDCILDTVVRGDFEVSLATGQKFKLATDESGWAKNDKGEQEIRVLTESDKPGIKIVRLPDGQGNETSYYATDALVTSYKKDSQGNLVENEKFAGLLPFYKEGADYDPDYCGRVWVIGLDIRKISANLLPGVKDNPQQSPKTVHPLRKMN